MLISFQNTYVSKLERPDKKADPNVDKPKNATVCIAVPSIKLFEKLKDAKKALDSFGVESDVCIVAAHWAPKKTLRFITEIESRGYDVIIAAADGSAHLPGMIASLTNVPVIGVPLTNEALDGMDSLLSIVQMPRGVPVGTMAINSAYNAGVFACQILSLKYPSLREKLEQHKQSMEDAVESEDAHVKKSIPNK